MSFQGKRYLTELFTAISLYVVALIASIWLLQAFPTSSLRIPIALAPMLPALLPVVIVHHRRRIDELQRQLQLEALGFAFASTAVVTFGYGFLETVGFPRISSFAVWPLMARFWIIGLWFAHWRFR
jgi:hypothetical protein